MSAFVASLKSDLLDRRFLPLLVVLGVALAGALAYAILGGGGSSTASSPEPAPNASSGAGKATAGVVIAPATANPKAAVSETTSGAPQRAGNVSDPFKPLPSAKAKSASASSTTTHASGGTPSSSSSSSKGSGSSGTGSGSSSSGTGSKPSKPQPPRQVYEVNVLFGVAPAGTSPQSIPLAAFNNLARLDPLTAGGEAPLVFAGVTSAGKSAIFTLVREVILHGPAGCRPSASQCQAIELKPGQSEELEYIVPGGQTLVYKLELVSITAVKASAAKAASVFHSESPAGRALLRRAGLGGVPGLRYLTATGVLVPSHPHAFAARASRRR